MSLGKFAAIYAIAFGIFLLIDAVWLGVISKNLYKNNIGHLMSENPKLLAALVFYMFFTAVMLYLAFLPGYNDRDLLKVVIYSALFGLVTYGTYDLTNYATLKDFPFKLVVIDMLWGMSITTATSVLTYLISIQIFK